MGAMYRPIMGDRRVPDYGLHGVLRNLLCGINGTRDLVAQQTGKAAATVAQTMLQPILDEARLAAKTCIRASFNKKREGKDGVCCCHTLHAEQGMGKKVVDTCLQHPSVRQHQVGMEKLGVGVQNLVGKFCKYVCVRLAFCMVH